MSNSIFDDTEIFTPEEGVILKEKSKIINLVTKIVKSKVFTKHYIMDFLKIKKPYLELIMSAEIYDLSLESLRDVEKPAQQLLEFVNYIQAQQEKNKEQEPA
jgi:hypothetical protein